MHHLGQDRRRALLGSLRGAVAVDGGPTDEQGALLDAVATHLLGLSLGDVEPLGPDAAGAAIVDEDERRILADGLIVLELARHPASAALAGRVEQYLSAVGADEDFQMLARDYVADARDRVMSDYQRVASPPASTPGAEGQSTPATPAAPDTPAAPEALVTTEAAELEDLAERFVALGSCAPGSVGRAFHDFYRRHGFAWPLDDPRMIAHDCSHVLAGYNPVPAGEIALEAMLTAATDGRGHYPGLLASLLLFEVGMLPFKDIVPKERVLARPGAAELFGEALRRGTTSGVDFFAVDLFDVADRDLAEVRRELGIEPPVPGPFTFVS